MAPLAEQTTEDIAEVERDATLASEASTGSAAHATDRTHCPNLVVLDPLGLVAEDVVGGSHLLETLLGCSVAGVGIRVELAGQLPVGLGDLLCR